MKIAPADVTYYSSAAEMLARYQRIHSTFWNPPVMPETEAAPPVPPETIRPPRRRPKLPEPPPDDPEELPAHFAAMLRHPLSRFEHIVVAVCDEFHITRHELLGRRRFAAVVKPRALTFALARHLTGRSLTDIGRRAGGFDHTTVLHAIRKMQPYIDAAADGMPSDATPHQWVAVMRYYMGI